MDSWYAVLILTVCAFFLFYKYVLQNFPSVISEQLMVDFNIQGLGLGILSGAYYWTYLIVPLFVGVIIDFFGVRWVTGSAILFCACGVLVFSKAYTLDIAVLARALIGIGASFATLTYMKMGAIWFSSNRYALLMGLLAFITMFGAVCGQEPLVWIIKSIGWRSSLLVLSIIGFVMTIVFMLVVREIPTKGIQEDASKHVKTALSYTDILDVVKNKKNILLMLYAGLAYSPVVIFCGLWANPFLQKAYHLDAFSASFSVSLVFAGLGLGGPLIALCPHRMNFRINLMIYTTLISAASVSFILYCPVMPIWVVKLLMFAFGFGLGASPLVFVVGKELNPLKLVGTALAMINGSEALFDAVTEPLIGKCLDAFHSPVINHVTDFSLQSYQFSLVILPIYQIIASLLLFQLKKMLRVSQVPDFGQSKTYTSNCQQTLLQ